MKGNFENALSLAGACDFNFVYRDFTFSPLSKLPPLEVDHSRGNAIGLSSTANFSLIATLTISIVTFGKVDRCPAQKSRGNDGAYATQFI